MKINSLVISFFLEILCVDNRFLTNNESSSVQPLSDTHEAKTGYKENILEKTMQPDPNSEELEVFSYGEQEKCAIIVMSNQGQTSQSQSLIRKYRYNESGSLIPSSVQYFIKFPQDKGGRAVLVPLKDKAFSPSGGFVRYYKEVPPIPLGDGDTSAEK